MDPNNPRFAEMRERMDAAEREAFDAYINGLPEGATIFWRCTVTRDSDTRPQDGDAQQGSARE